MAMQVGHAISEWAGLEDFLMDLFSVLIGQHATVASAILSRIMSFSLKLDIVDAVASLALDGKPELRFWKSLKAYMIELSGDRNNMAHSPIMRSREGFTIGPSVTLHIAGNAKRTLSLEELEELVKDISLCKWTVYGFRVHLSGDHPRNEVYHRPVQRRRPPRAERLAKR